MPDAEGCGCASWYCFRSFIPERQGLRLHWDASFFSSLYILFNLQFNFVCGQFQTHGFAGCKFFSSEICNNPFCTELKFQVLKLCSVSALAPFNIPLALIEYDVLNIVAKKKKKKFLRFFCYSCTCSWNDFYASCSINIYQEQLL